MTTTSHSRVFSTRIDSLDESLFRGLPRGDAHSVESAAATGQTTSAEQFVLEGTQQDDCRLDMTLFEWNSST
jgi:KaiC/GvpD/RAD55 family RecA-like ATPase